MAVTIPGPRGLWGSYCSSLQRRPILTKSVTSLIGFALGDAVAQFSNRNSSSEYSRRYDTYRTVRMAVYGGLIAGPVGHYWFDFLDANVFAKTPKSMKAIASKICLDQAFMTPLGTTLFFSFAKLMDMQPGTIPSTIQEKLAPTCLASLKLWPLAHAVNFAVIPASQRLLYINVVSIFWTTLLSSAASQGVRTEAIASSPPQLVVVPVLEEEQEALASVGFLDEMEALEMEYDKDK